MVWVLGLGGSNHDFSAVLLENGCMHTAIEDERLTGHRYGDTHWTSRPCQPSSQYCLRAANIDFKDLDGLFVSADLEGHDPFWEKLSAEKVGHHLCHAAAAYYPSPFAAAALLVIDGRGGPVTEPYNGRRRFETVSIGAADDNQLSLETVQTGQQAIATSTWSYISSNSVGWFYSIVTEAVGLGENGEGKTMALAAYGQPRFVEKLKDFVAVSEEVVFTMDPYAGIWDYLIDTIHVAPSSFAVRADLAASAQAILEEAVLTAGRQAKRRSDKPYLAYGGGVALNGVANHRLQAECGFRNVFVFPASGDNGLSCGAALYGTHQLLKQPRPAPSWRHAASFAYGGRSYSAREIEMAYADEPVAVRHRAGNSDCALELVDRLLAGEVVAVYRGGAEFGPRALGHRSLLALPWNENIQSKMNGVKRRESFRPFAPIVLEERAGHYFDLNGPSPFMLDIAPIRTEHRVKLAGICHVDGTARIQTVGTGGSEFLRRVLLRLQELGEPPVLLNTSFNLKGRPIVETPKDAVTAFIQLDVKALLLEETWLEKHTQLPQARTGSMRHAY
jgi:carbamoyltransferase